MSTAPPRSSRAFVGTSDGERRATWWHGSARSTTRPWKAGALSSSKSAHTMITSGLWWDLVMMTNFNFVTVDLERAITLRVYERAGSVGLSRSFLVVAHGGTAKSAFCILYDSTTTIPTFPTSTPRVPFHRVRVQGACTRPQSSKSIGGVDPFALKQVGAYRYCRQLARAVMINSTVTLDTRLTYFLPSLTCQRCPCASSRPQLPASRRGRGAALAASSLAREVIP